MMMRNAVLALALLGGASAQDAQMLACQSDLVSLSDQFNAACCADPSNCASGAPVQCDAGCAAIWNPFYAQCQNFVDTTLTNLRSFATRCQRAAPAPPPGSGPGPTYQGPDQYVDVTFATQGANVGTTKRMNTYKTSFRSDLAVALDIDTFAILIDTADASSVHAIIFPPDGTDAQSLLTRITTQASIASSPIRSGAAQGSATIRSATGQVITRAPPPPPGQGFATDPSSPVGHVHISVDNSYTLYINGAELGDGSDWSQTDTYDFSAPCAGDLVVAFHGVDAGGPAAGLVSVEHCGYNIISNHNWRCTAAEPADDSWTSAGYVEDASWEVPAHGGVNGVPPWGHRPDMDVPNANGMQSPSWIWTSDFQGTDEVWCRYDKNADDDHLQGANGLGNGGWGQGHFCADDGFTLYINGQEIAQGHDWQDTQAFTFGGPAGGRNDVGSIPCDQDNVYAVEGTNTGGGAGFIGDITHCGREISTQAARWKCSTECPKGWEAQGFDDSAWEIATDFGPNGDNFGGPREVDSEAHWIWANTGAGGCTGKSDCAHPDNEHACCRYTTTGSRRINCNAARMRYQEDYLQIVACHNTGGATAANGDYCNYDNTYAYTHFLQNGEAAGFIWHDELCNVDGTDVAVTLTDHQGTVAVVADNGYHLYINGQEIGSGESWYNTDVYTFDAPCDSPTVYAIDAYDLGGIASVMMEATHCGEQVRTDTRWKCMAARDAPNTYCSNEGDPATATILPPGYVFPGTTWGGEQACRAACEQDPTCIAYEMNCGANCGRAGQVQCDSESTRGEVVTGDATQERQCILLKECTQEVPSVCGTFVRYMDGRTDTAWTTAQFDDSTWPTALDGGDNGVSPWGLRSSISGEAHWIWTQDTDAHDSVYCRYVSNHVDIHCPAAAARYLRDYPDLQQYPELDAFDHYNAREGGKSEGRIWHSELCNADGTNKGSHCEIIHTADEYHYQFLSEPLQADVSITFAVRANNDAHIGFFETNNGNEAGDAGDLSGASHGPQYEIVLSGWGGTQSVIREQAQGANHAVTDTTGVISADDSRQFWASAANGLIRLGRGNVVGFSVLLQWHDPDAILDIHWAAVATGWGSDGDWIVCLPENCAGWHDGFEATLTGNVEFQNVPDGGQTQSATGDGLDDGFTGQGVINFMGDSDGAGGHIYNQNTGVESVTWSLYGCHAGTYDLGIPYFLPTGGRPLMLEVNGVTVGSLPFQGPARAANTGAGGSAAASATWGEQYAPGVTFSEGMNTVTLTAQGQSGPDIDMLEVNRANGRDVVSSHGVVRITADNGYILYINGDRIAAGGAALPADDPMYERDGWLRTDTWAFRDSCQTPTAYAIEAVDSEGVAAVLAEADHCGFTTNTGTEWKCAVAGCTPGAATGTIGCSEVNTRTYHVLDTAMGWAEARQACRQQFPGGDLASIHNAEQQDQAAAVCRAQVEQHLPDGGLSTEFSQGCWIGLNDQAQERRVVWSDGSPVDYLAWAPGEPNALDPNNHDRYNEDFVEMDFRGGSYGNGLWNDASTGNYGNTGGCYPLCESLVYVSDYQFQYMGCFIDAPDRDMDGLTHDGTTAEGASNGENGVPPPFYVMGVGSVGDSAEPIDGDPRQVCAQLCTGFRYFALQFYNACFCDNANGMSLGSAPEAECNTPCNGHDGSDGQEAIMCGGAWRNSVYEMHTSNWEAAGYDDTMWESAKSIGPNGVSPWYHRPGISAEANWIWTQDQNDHDHVFCRFTQSNAEVNCPAAQAKYWFDYPDVRARNFPAWQHFQDEGRDAGNQWHSELCNTCTAAEMATTDCVQNADGATAGAHNSQLYCTSLPCENPSCEQHECTDKCRGIHIASEAALVGARVDGQHAGHYGMGFVDYINPTGDSVTFTLNSCNAGQHHVGITYALASADPPRPLQVSVNGVNSGAPVLFPATGAWTEWGKTFTQVQLTAGVNHLTLTATENSGPNLDYIEIFPVGDDAQGVARIAADNAFQFYVNNRLVGSGNDWTVTSTIQFNAECDTPTVYAVHATDAAASDTDVAGFIADINHCGENFFSGESWRCTAANMPGGSAPPEAWNEPNFDDSAWEIATDFGPNGANPWGAVKSGGVAGHDPSSETEDGISMDAHWIWTSDGAGHDDIYCRLVKTHEPINCRPAAERYWSDYSDVQYANYPAWEHYLDYGRWESRVWHSELCGNDCGYKTAAFDWLDAQQNGVLVPKMGDDDLYEIDLPFDFPFYDQYKNHIKISSNGYVSFSGETFGYGNTRRIHNSNAPNDMIAVFWTDLDPSRNGGRMGDVYTWATTGQNCMHGIASDGVCCAASCGTCGGTGCQNRPGGRAACCKGAVRDNSPACSDNGQQGPCVMDGQSFVVEWVNMPVFCGPPNQNYGTAANCALVDQSTSTFQLILYPSGEIKMQYQNVLAPQFRADVCDHSGRDGNSNGCRPGAQQNPWYAAGTYAKLSVGIENAAGNEGLQIAYDDASFPAPNTAYIIKKSCGSSLRSYSLGWCPQYGSAGCDFQYADTFCRSVYGGQLASPKTQQEYDLISAIVGGPSVHPTDHPCPNCVASIDRTNPCDCGCAGRAADGTCIPATEGYNEQYLLGFHSDGQGNWESTDTSDAKECHHGLCDPSTIQQIHVSQAGDNEWNGVYHRVIDGSHPSDGIAFMKDDTHEIYRYAPGGSCAGGTCVWRFADYGVATYYVATAQGLGDNELPPADPSQWRATAGHGPMPSLNLASDACVHCSSAVDTQFIRTHSGDGMAGTGETSSVYFSGTNTASLDANGFPFGGTGGFHDVNTGGADPTHAWQVEGFICGFFAAPGQIVIGEDMTFDEAETFCQVKTGGHLYSIHTQQDYDHLKEATIGYTKPVMIGLRSDSAGNWEWTDGSPVDLTWLRAHSDDGLEGVDENKAVFYPPTADAADWDCGDPTQAHSCSVDADNHGLHDWGLQTDGNRMAFACSSAGESRGNRGSRGDAAVCNNGVPPPNCPTCNCALNPGGGGH